MREHSLPVKRYTCWQGVRSQALLATQVIG
jgi:hypothetical protein